MELQELKDRVNLLDYIQDNGVNINKVGVETYRVNPCPVCGHHDHFTIYTNTNSYCSFSECCKGGSIIDYMTEVEGLSMNEAIEKLKTINGGNNIIMSKTETLGVNSDKGREGIIGLVEMAKANSCDYYRERGLTEKTINKYGLGYLPDGCKYGKGYKYVLPVSDKHLIVRNDNDSSNERYKNFGSVEIFNIRYLYDPTLTGKYIFITEGIFDALSIEEMDLPAVSLNSITISNKFIDVIKDNKNQLNGKVLVLALDNDLNGQKASDKIKETLSELNLAYTELNLSSYKDVNEYFVEDPELLKKIVKGLDFVGTNYEYMLHEFEADQAQRLNEPKIITGFNKLDQSLKGGLFPGFYVLGSIPSLGKTALALQFADNIAKRGHGVLFFSLEMGRYELTCRSITRLLFEEESENNLSTGDMINVNYQFRDDKSGETHKKILNYYMDNIAKNITIVEGNFSLDVKKLREIIINHIHRFGNKPVVFVDYLQVLKPLDFKFSDKQHVDFTTVELKRISRDFDIPIVAVSSFNRSNYKSDVSYEAFKESGSIEYTADVVFGLQFRKNKVDDINELKNLNPRPLELVILKNRRGEAYKKIELDYFPQLNYFYENS